MGHLNKKNHEKNGVIENTTVDNSPVSNDFIIKNYDEKLAELKEKEELLLEREHKLNALLVEIDLERKKNAFEGKLVEKKSQINTQKEQELAALEEQLLGKRVQLHEMEQDLLSREINFKNDIDKRRFEAEKEIEQLKSKAVDEANDLKIKRQQELCELHKTETAKLMEWKDEQLKSINESYEILNNKISKDIEEKRIEMFAKMQKEIDQEKQEQLKRLADEINAKKAEVEAEKEKLDRLEQERQKNNDELIAKIKELELKIEDSIIQDKIKANTIARFEERYNGLDEEVRRKYESQLDAYQKDIKRLEDSLYEMGESYNSVNNELVHYQNFADMFPGNTVEMVHQRLMHLEKTKNNLLDELAKRPDESVKLDLIKKEREYNDLSSKFEELNNRYSELTAKNKTYNHLEIEKNRLQYEYDCLKVDHDFWQNRVATLQNELLRLSSTEAMLEEYDKRVEDIRQEYLKGVTNPHPDDEQPQDEIEWLNEISENCLDYGISFPKRILYAFHTALKISDWSMITVLSGVSGTGKSELPRLYSMFGKLNFINVPVQPNWDSQESMLGYYNSIDNKFDAQPLLRFLVQCTETLNECMSIVLLDEMNLAHVEYYFADFLSKLEQRRGVSKANVPRIEVKLGAGVKPYELPLSRNILWCGTMNQDETTKSLSDKVLDRGAVINFPRPKELKGRKKMGLLGKFVDSKVGHKAMLSYKTWRHWIAIDIERDSYIEEPQFIIKGFVGEQLEELNRLRNVVEKINDCLGFVGRALGHRVWQSIEYYIANYPEVIATKRYADGQLTDALRKAMHIAFEDQIVQKVMPKLRGIDTRGLALEKCLNPIKQILIDENLNLENDFEKAMQLGYGQFIWCSAEYIDDNEIARIKKDNENGSVE